MEELREIGADVNLIKEYSDKLRVYLKSVIKTNKQNQEKKIQVTKSLYCEVFFTKYWIPEMDKKAYIYSDFY